MSSTDEQITEGTPRRFELALFIVHPTLTPTEITAEIGLQPNSVHAVGEQRTTPVGTPLPGKYQDMRWRHRMRHEVSVQWFIPALNEFVGRLARHKRFFERIKSTGGNACLILSFLGDGHFGDVFPAATLAQIADLQLDFGIEVFSVPQA